MTNLNFFQGNDDGDKIKDCSVEDYLNRISSVKDRETSFSDELNQKVSKNSPITN